MLALQMLRNVSDDLRLDLASKRFNCHPIYYEHMALASSRRLSDVPSWPGRCGIAV
jgi:hypothetical protein